MGFPGRIIRREQIPIPEYQQQQPVVQEGSHSKVIAHLIQEEKINNFISQTSPGSSLDQISYALKGYIYDREQKGWIKIAEGIPEEIRLDFLQFLTADLGENLRMNNLSIAQINGVMHLTIEWVVDYLDLVAEENNLSEEQMTKIALILMKAIYYTLLRSQDGIERNKMFKALSLEGDTNPMPNKFDNKKPFWKFWK